MALFMKPTRLLAPALGLLALLAGGCASFYKDWDRARASQKRSIDVEGLWQGTWRSEASGHHDLLQCIITRRDTEIYDARFHAKYHTVFTFNYTVPLTVQTTNGVSRFQGAANLGWLAGGMYHYDGSASATNFTSTYTSKYDHGVFEMTRP